MLQIQSIGENDMTITLDAFCKDARQSLTSGKPLPEALDAIAARLRDLLNDPTFVQATFSPDDPAGKKELFHDPELDFYVLAHVQEGGKKGTPHSHGESWAIYGNATGVTRMTEYVRVNPISEEAAILQVSDVYDIGPGQTRGYGPGMIHSTEHPGKSWVIRITGTDLDALPRYRFRKFRDSIVEAA
jgi:hypothetical protein